MKSIVFITPSDMEYGFRLAGVRHIITDEAGFRDIIMKVIREADTGLVIVDERLLKTVSEDELRKIEQTFPGILLDLPAPERPETEIEAYAANLIRRAIGYHVKLTL